MNTLSAGLNAWMILGVMSGGATRMTVTRTIPKILHKRKLKQFDALMLTKEMDLFVRGSFQILQRNQGTGQQRVQTVVSREKQSSKWPLTLSRQFA